MATQAGVRWVGKAPVTGGSNRLTKYDQNNPTLQWATGSSSIMYDNMFEYMEESHRMAKQAVQNLSRVDTGLMRHMADSLLHVRGDTIELNFGWWADAPHYAVYQEFGTAYIRPMLAVHAVFEEIHTGLPRAMGG